jgi:4-hydroxybenzoate polyprenyltransferase
MNFRTLLVLGRISNLPTVWSNLLAGSIFAGVEGNLPVVLLLLTGGSLIYIGGMYLNDFCDAAFDARYCPERPIPSGKISRAAVGQLAVLWFVPGFACLALLPRPVPAIALLLIAAVVLYDFRHKGVSMAPLLMGFCRFLLYPLAASASESFSIWQYVAAWPYVCMTGAALGLYVAGITYLARGESRPGKPARWALLLLVTPIVLALNIGAPRFLFPEILLASLVLVAWMAWLLIPLWRKTNPSIGRVVSGLLAGIVLVDILAVVPFFELQAAWFLLLFFFALLLQRFVPAT